MTLKVQTSAAPKLSRPMRRLARVVLCVALPVLLPACGRDTPDPANLPAESATTSGNEPAVYQPAESTLVQFGSLAVTVSTLDSSVVDTTVFPIRDFETCGSQLIDNSVQREGNLLAGAITWLSGIVSGKQLPVARRYEVLHQRCLLWPRAQAVAVGGTLNIRNMDAAVHILRFTDVASGEVLARVTQSEQGQVVPNEYMLVTPRVIEVTCESHPWTKAWIHVFDHPYYGVTNRSGMVVMDSVPAGVHQVVTWHERFGERRDSVTVAAATRGQLSLELSRRPGSLR
jgi:hypothetical protein